MPLTDCEVRDPRIRRTRLLLHEALLGLMQSRSFEEISVQDITDRATVNRATFYDHYADKFALLDAIIGGGFHKLLHDRDVMYNASCPSAASAIIRAVCDYQVQMHHGHGDCKAQSPFEPLIDAAIVAAIRRVFAGNIPAPGLPSEMVATAASAAIYAAAKQWFNAANRPPVDEIVPQILALVLPMLSTVIQGDEVLAAIPIPL